MKNAASARLEATAPAEEAVPPAPEAEDAVQRVLDRVHVGEVQVASPASTSSPAADFGLKSGKVRYEKGGVYFVTFRGKAEQEVDIADDVDVDLIRRAADQGDRVLVENDPELGPVIVGVIATKLPDLLEIRAKKIIIEGEEEVLMRSGSAAVRLREDGDVEVVGSRITTMSRGLFRLVGRMLRLN